MDNIKIEKDFVKNGRIIKVNDDKNKHKGTSENKMWGNMRKVRMQEKSTVEREIAWKGVTKT
jgi:hypothetical protein